MDTDNRIYKLEQELKDLKENNESLEHRLLKLENKIYPKSEMKRYMDDFMDEFKLY